MCEKETSEVLTIEDVAAYLRMHPDDLQNLRKTIPFPHPFLIGKLERWRRKEIERYVELLAEYGDVGSIPEEDFEGYDCFLTLDQPKGNAEQP